MTTEKIYNDIEIMAKKTFVQIIQDAYENPQIEQHYLLQMLTQEIFQFGSNFVLNIRLASQAVQILKPILIVPNDDLRQINTKKLNDGQLNTILKRIINIISINNQYTEDQLKIDLKTPNLIQPIHQIEDLPTNFNRNMQTIYQILLDQKKLKPSKILEGIADWYELIHTPIINNKTYHKNLEIFFKHCQPKYRKVYTYVNQRSWMDTIFEDAFQKYQLNLTQQQQFTQYFINLI